MKNKSLLLLAALFSFLAVNTAVIAQAPGGVTGNLDLWIKAGSGVTVTAGKVSQWNNQVGTAHFSQSYVPMRPTLNAANPFFNGNASVDFDMTDDGMYSSNLVSAKHYSVFVVYNSTSTSTAARRAVQGSNGWLIGPYANSSRFYTGVWVYNTATYTASTAPVLNTGTSSDAAANNAFFYINGQNVTPSGVTSTGFPNFINLGSEGNANEKMGGGIAEVIAFNRTLGDAERNRVESYLAVKYGLHLSQSTPTNYVNSTGAVIWDYTYNGVYKNNIFGIGKDNGSGLNQTQSVSHNTSVLSISNPSALGDGDFLLLSDNGLSIAPQAQPGLPGGALAASPRIWSVSKTGTVGTVSITIQSAESNPVLLIDNDNNGIFETALTASASSGNSYTYTGISLNQYAKIKIGFLTAPPAPGGVNTNLKLWLRGSDIVPVNGAVPTWPDYSGNGSDATQTLQTAQPTYAASSGQFNGNATVNFDISNDGMLTPAVISAKPYSVFAVYNSTSTSTAARRAVNSSNNWLIGPYQNKNGFYGGAWVYQSTSNANLTPTICTGTASSAATLNGFFYLNSKQMNATGVTANTVPGTLSLGASGANANPLGGDMAEVIAYSGLLSAAERNKVESYLAVKYGIPLDQTTATNYTNSSGGVVWDATVNGAYKNNIFGIGKDAGSGLNQAQSVCVNTNRVRIDNPSALDNGNYFLLSDNNLSITPVATGGLPGGATLATPLAWNVSKTGTVGTLDLTFVSPTQGAMLLIDNDNNGVFETAVMFNSQVFGNGAYTYRYNGLSLNHNAKLKLGYKCSPAQNNVVSITPLVVPALNTCHSQGTFTVRVTNLSPNPINNLIFRDSMPPSISYVPGSVSGTGVTFNSTLQANNVVAFNIATIPSSGYVDVSWDASVDCGVSSDAASIVNTYRAYWDCYYSAPYVTPSYSILFPSLSITMTNGNASVSCYSTFVRQITVCNGGYGALDSVTVSDTESGSSLIIKNFNRGITSSLGTPSAKTVLKAADFMTVGNFDGVLDQNECIVIDDTLQVIGSATPIAGIIRADWGCLATQCPNGTTNNVVTVNTIISGSSGNGPTLTRTLTVVGAVADSASNIYNRPMTLCEVVKNNSQQVATNVFILPYTTGLKYFVYDSIWASFNGGARYHPPVSQFSYGWWTKINPSQFSTNSSPTTFPNYNKPSNAQITLPDLFPGDSVVVTFELRSAGPITKYTNVGDGSPCDGNHPAPYCGPCLYQSYGPRVCGVFDFNMSWGGCPGGTFNACTASFPIKLFNGQDAALVTEPNYLSGQGVYLARFNGFSLTDSTNLDNQRCAYEEDTLKLRFNVSTLDLPFYTSKSKFYINIKTNGGVKWDGNLNAVFGRLTSWTNNPWYADQVVDRTAIDSTIRVYFKYEDLPAAALTALNSNTYNSYQAGAFQLVMHVINDCPGPPVKRIYLTRFYQIDTTSADPGIESGNWIFEPGMEWNSICPADPCDDGVQIFSFSQKRTTYGAPDNNGDGIADASGSLNQNVIIKNRITWSDTLQVKHKMIIRTTQPGGVPYLKMRTDILYADTNAARTLNLVLRKAEPQIVLKRPGVGVFTGTGTSLPVSYSYHYVSNLSLQGAGGTPIPGITSYEEGDTVEVTENIVYWKPHQGWGLVEWNLLHVPYTSLVANPTNSQKFRCDSVICNVETVDMGLAMGQSVLNGGSSCGTDMVQRVNINAQIASSNCGTNYFPGEARHIINPIYYKFVIPATSRWSLTSVRVHLNTNIKTCQNPVSNQLVPPSLYFFSGDTLMLDIRAIHLYFGYNVDVSNLYSNTTFDLGLHYTPSAVQTGCVKDHSDIQTTFTTFGTFDPIRPMYDTTLFTKPQSYATATLAWPAGNNNSFTTYAGTSFTVTNPNVVLKVQYNKGSSGVYGNDFIAIPDAYGIVVDSVKDQVTGQKLVTAAGSKIYQVGYLAANSNRKYDIYTRVTLCSNNQLKIYADRTPCSGYPASWADYACQANASSATFNYVTYQGELQMVDSLYHTQKDICTEDTLQFRVINSQTQDANTIQVKWKMPPNSSVVPGHAHYKLGNGAFVTASDPVYSAGWYTWTLPSTDTLYRVSLTPLNTLILRVGIMTSCGYVSGSQIKSKISGYVGCGPISSLYNTNPPPLKINGAPTLSYFTNPKITAEQIDDCVPGAGRDYSVYLLVSGSATGASDSARVTLPPEYDFHSYNPAAPGAHNAPATVASMITLPDGYRQLTWHIAPGILPGDSIKFTFKYKEGSMSNKCAASPDRYSKLSTVIATGVYCVTLNAICPVSIENGADSILLQSKKPSLSTITYAAYTQGCDNTGSKSYLDLQGSITNNGSAAVAAGTDIVMELFMDLDNSGTINAGDHAFDPVVYNGGLAIGSTYDFMFSDTILAASCTSCPGKKLLLRFSNTPSSPSGATQCLCDTVLVTSITPTVVINVKPNAGADQTVNCAVLPGGLATLAASGIGSWSAKPGNPGTSTIVAPNSPFTNVTTFSTAGDYYYIWTDGACNDTVKVSVTAKPNAGSDQSVTCVLSFPGGSATMAGTGPGTWTAQTGNPGTANIVTSGSPTTVIDNFSAAGTYKFNYTYGSCTDTAQVVVTSVVEAGPNQTAACAVLPGGSVTTAAIGTGAWTAYAGNPGTAVITTPTSPTTTITTFSAAGTYKFYWTEGTCVDSMNVTVTAKPDAGPDQTATCVSLPGGTISMAATGSGTWSAYSGNPGTAVITTPTSPTTTITTFSVSGSYYFIFTNGTCTDTAKVTVTMKPNAGADKLVCVPSVPNGTAVMSGVGLGTWTAAAGNPGTATINFPNSQSTSISNFSALGDYKFVFTWGACSDTAVVSVSAQPDGGADKTVSCLPTFPGGSATMSAVGTGTWAEVSGNPGTSTITNPGSATTTITTFSAAGVYKYRWNDGLCNDTVRVTVTAKPYGGPDQSLICVPAAGAPATMAASGTGTWAAQTGNPTPAPVITTATNPTTTITGFKTAGTYKYIWTDGNGCKDTIAVTVTAVPNAGADKSATCVVFPGGSVTMAATAVAGGEWSAAAGNPGTATITNTALATTTITTFSAAGTYKFIWTNGAGCKDTAAVTITPKPYAGPDQSLVCIPTQPGGSVTMAASGSGAWTAHPSNPGAATITFSLVPTTTITAFTWPGVYQFIWTDAVTGCTDTVAINTTFKPYAGPDQTIVCAGPGATLTGTIVTTGTWTELPGNPAGGTLGATTNGVAHVSYLSTTSGVFTYIYTAGTCADTMSVTVYPQPNAGPDKVICQFQPVNLSAIALSGASWIADPTNPTTTVITNIADPATLVSGLASAGTYKYIWKTANCADTMTVTVTAKPNAGTDQTGVCAGYFATLTGTGPATGTWSAQAGNAAGATLGSTTGGAATVTFATTASGTYYFVYTADGCTDTMSVTVTAKPSAGADQTGICAGTSATLTGTNPATGTWSAQAGNPAGATLGSTTGGAATVDFTTSASGNYYYVYTANGCTDTMSVTVTAKPNAGADQTGICGGSSATLTGTGPTTGTWSAQAGNPAGASLGSTTSGAATVTFATSASGTFNFVYTADGCTDTMSVAVTAKPSAGADQTGICAGTSATLTGTGPATGTWSAQAGNPAGATLGSTTGGIATVDFATSASGTYYYVYTANGCTDTVSVAVTAKPNAGADQVPDCFATLAGSSVTMAATGTGTWTALAGNPGTASITTPGSATTTVTNFSAEGTYGFIWTVNGCADTMTVQIRRCIKLSGRVFNDVGGLLNDNTVNGTGTNAGGLTVILVTNSGIVAGKGMSMMTMVGNATVASDGTYEFADVLPGTYSLVLSTVPGVSGQPAPASSLPSGWENTGENLGLGAGSDGTNDGILTPVTVVAVDVTDADFGIEEIPMVGSGSNNAVNPGGNAQVTVPPNTFTNSAMSSDFSSGTVTGIRITAFPSGVVTIVINGVSYTSATFPPGGVVVPTDGNGAPTQTITVDPSVDNGASTVTIPFVSIDNAGQESGTSGTAVLNMSGCPGGCGGTTVIKN